MVTVNKDQLKKAINLFQGAYKNFTMTKELFDVWFAEICTWEVGCFDKAVAECLSTCEYPPNLAELKKRYEALFKKREEAKGWYIAEYMTFLRMFPEYHTEGVIELYAELTLKTRTTACAEHTLRAFEELWSSTVSLRMRKLIKSRLQSVRIYMRFMNL